MSRPTPSFPPPTEPTARYDAVVRRGHQLRRRQRLVRGAGAGGAALALVLVVVLVAGAVGGTDDQTVANGPTTSTSSTTTTADPTAMSVVVMADARAVAVTVDDPVQPADPSSQVCVHVRLAVDGGSGVAAAVGDVCWRPEVPGDTMSTLQLANGVEIGCPAVVERDDGAPPTTPPATRRVHHTFSFDVPRDLAAGRYVAEVTAVSGIGDGCPPGDQAGEIEHVQTGQDGLTYP